MVNGMTKMQNLRGRRTIRPSNRKTSTVTNTISYGISLPMLLVTMVAEAIMSSAYDTDDSEDESGTFMDPKTGRVSVRHSRRAYFSARGKCPKYPDTEPGEDGALAAYRTWDKGLRDWIEENELESLLREDSGGLPGPSPSSGEAEEEKGEEAAVVKPVLVGSGGSRGTPRR